MILPPKPESETPSPIVSFSRSLSKIGQDGDTWVAQSLSVQLLVFCSLGHLHSSAKGPRPCFNTGELPVPPVPIDHRGDRAFQVRKNDYIMHKQRLREAIWKSTPALLRDSPLLNRLPVPLLLGGHHLPDFFAAAPRETRGAALSLLPTSHSLCPGTPRADASSVTK